MIWDMMLFLLGFRWVAAFEQFGLPLAWRQQTGMALDQGRKEGRSRLGQFGETSEDQKERKRATPKSDRRIRAYRARFFLRSRLPSQN
jgi:hypothetical protein